MSNKRTRERHLAKLAARRKAARQRHARQKWTAIIVAIGCVAVSRLTDFKPGFVYGFVASSLILGGEAAL